MTKEAATQNAVPYPSAFPDECEIAEWEALSREQQFDYMVQLIEQAHASGESPYSREEIKARAKERVAQIRAQAQLYAFSRRG